MGDVRDGRWEIRWEKGGEARVAAAAGDAVELVSTIPSAPGSRLGGALQNGTAVRVKVARCRRIATERADEPPTYRIEGRLLDASRSLREELAALATA